MALAFCLGAAAAIEEGSFWCESVAEGSALGKANELVTSRTPLTSRPTREPVAVVGKAAEHSLAIFIITCGRNSQHHPLYASGQYLFAVFPNSVRSSRSHREEG